MFTSAQNLSLVQTELDDVFYQSFARMEAPGLVTADSSDIFKVKNTDHANYITQVYQGVGIYSVVGEAQNTPAGTPRVANKQTTFVKTFAEKIEISKELFDDNLHDAWRRSVESLGEMAKVTQDITAFGIFRGAFTTTLTSDGVSLINSAHPLISGTTISNVISGALSDTTLNNAMVALMQQKNQAGVVMGSVGSILLVPPALFKTAVEITKSVLSTGTVGANNVNFYSSVFPGLKVVQSPYLGTAQPGGSDTAWFLMAPNHSVSRLVRQGIQTALRDWTYSDNRTYLYQANYREEYFVPDYAGIVGSTGL